MLVLHLVRFFDDGTGRAADSLLKDERPVTIDSTLQFGDAFYALRSVVVHIGQTLRGGHYVCYERTGGGASNSADGWVRYDDARVSDMTDPTQRADVRAGAYLLFYERVGRAVA